MIPVYSYSRWSSAIQAFGDSKNRQKERLAIALSEHPDWVLQETLIDDGKSAFKGKNLSETAALGEWLTKVQTGEVPANSILIIEALDRLTRQELTSAIGLILQIISSGCQIYICIDRQLVNQQTINNDPSTIYILMARLQTANMESKRKSQLLSAAWGSKEKLAINHGIPMTAKVPFWIELTPDRKDFKVKEEVAEVINFIFESYLSGASGNEIARYCNSNFPFRSWSFNGINKLLKNESVIGNLTRQYRPGVIEGYYPQIIDTETFQAVQNQMKANVSSSGPRMKSFSNLFSGLIKCRVCGENYRSVSNQTYLKLICRAKDEGRPCNSESIKYPSVEDDIIEFLFKKGLVSTVEQTKPDKTVSLRLERDQLNAKLQNFLALIESGDAPISIISRMREIESRLGQIDIEIAALNKSQSSINKEKMLEDFWEFMNNKENPETRKKIIARLRQLIDFIEMDGFGYQTFDESGNVDGRVRNCFIKLSGNDDLIPWTVGDEEFKRYARKKNAVVLTCK